jgi:DNA-binding beta-propeller fold protein YncE
MKSQRAWGTARSRSSWLSEPLGSTGDLALNPVTGRIYISALAINVVSILDPKTLKMIRRITTEPTPDGIYFTTVQ